MPAVAVETEAALRVKFDSFSFEQVALQIVTAMPQRRHGDFSPRIDHAMPRNGIGQTGRNPIEGIANYAGFPGQTRQGRNLSVGGDAAHRNLANNSVDLVVATHP